MARTTAAPSKPARQEQNPGTTNLDKTLFDRLPPQELECERGIIGSMLLDPRVCDDVLMILAPRDFYSDANRTIYVTLAELHAKGKGVDPTLLHNALKKQGSLEMVGGLAYLLEVVDSVPHAANAVYYAKIVRDAGLRRELIHTATEALRDGYADGIDVGEVIARYERKLGDLNAARNADQMKQGVEVGLSLLQRLKRGKPRGPGVDFGLSKFDQILGGMHAGDLVLLAARTSVGKSALATSLIAHQLATSDRVCYFCSLEMSEEQLMERIVCNMASVDSMRLRNHWCNPDELQRIADAVALIGDKLYIDRASYRTVGEVIAMARRAKRTAKGRLDYVVVDYLQLMDSSLKGRPRHEQVSEISRSLKNAAFDLGVPILALAQLNREADGGKPRLSHLRESGSLEQDADRVIFIDRDTTADESNGAVATLIVAKNRDAKIGECQAAWFGGYQRFAGLEGDDAF